jgi:hypothetical protein
VGPLHGWGGLERAVDDLCTSLACNGHDVTLFTADGVLREPARDPRSNGSPPAGDRLGGWGYPGYDYQRKGSR